MTRQEAFNKILNSIASLDVQEGIYKGIKDYAYIVNEEKKRLESELKRLAGIKKIITNWQKYASDYKKEICAIDPAPITGKTRLWTQNYAYQALNEFLSQYSIEYRKRNKTFGAKRIYVVKRGYDRETAAALADVIDEHQRLKIDVGIVFKEDIESLVDSKFYNCNVIPDKMATDAERFEECGEHPIVIIDNKNVVKDTYEVFKLLSKKSIKFDNNKVSVSTSFSNGHTRKRIYLPAHVKFYVALKSGGLCAQCGGGENLQYDHAFPFSLGGANDPENFQLLCARCNKKKSNKI